MKEYQNLRRSERILGRSKQRSISEDESYCVDTAEIKESQMFAPDVPDKKAENRTEINGNFFEVI